MNSKRDTHQLLNDNPVEHGEEEPQMVNELEVSTGNLASTDVVMEGMLTQQESNDDHIVMAMFPAQTVNPETGESVMINVYLKSGAKRTCIDAQAEQLHLSTKQELVLETSCRQENRTQITSRIRYIIKRNTNTHKREIQ